MCQRNTSHFLRLCTFAQHEPYTQSRFLNNIYKDMYTTENIEAIGGIDNMNRWVKEMQKNDMRIKRNKFLDSVFTLVLDAALIYGIVILTMRIFL